MTRPAMVSLKRFVNPNRPITYGIVQAGEDVDDGVPYIRPVDMAGHSGVLDVGHLRKTSWEIAAAYARSTVRAGDLIVSIGPSYGKTMIVPSVLDGANLTQGTARIAPADGIDRRFLRWALRSSTATEYWDAAVSGATFRALNLEPLSRTPVPMWGLMDQKRIADFLDAETARIDGLIERKHRMTGLLEARLTGVIDRVMANDGTLRRLKHLCRKPLQYGANQPAEYDEPSWPRYIRTTDIDERGALRAETFRSLPPDVAQPYLLRDGDLLFTRSGATVGKSFFYRAEWGEACFAGYLIRATLDTRVVSPRYIAYFFRSSDYWNQIREATLQATIQNVSAERYGDVVVRIPTFERQDEIADVLDVERARVEKVVDKLAHQADLLREHRQALITAAVTSELDIAKAAA